MGRQIDRHAPWKEMKQPNLSVMRCDILFWVVPLRIGDLTDRIRYYEEKVVVEDEGSEQTIYAWLYRLRTEARRVGGDVHLVTGNHEWMNVRGDTRYASPRNMVDFCPDAEYKALTQPQPSATATEQKDADDSKSSNDPFHNKQEESDACEQGRLTSFTFGGPMACTLAQMATPMLTIGQWVVRTDATSVVRKPNGMYTIADIVCLMPILLRAVFCVSYLFSCSSSFVCVCLVHAWWCQSHVH